MFSKNILYFGQDTLLPRQHLLRSGPLTGIYEQGDLRYMRLGEHEVIRRIYVAVRDHNWNTVPAVIDNERIESNADSFLITFNVKNQQGSIDFSWNAVITGDQFGTITYHMEGEAHSTFLRNRIGFCVLHPIQECVGQPCTIELTDGQLQQSEFPRYIAPHQPFLNMRAITHEILPGTRAEVRFSGDVFEMEDQRNWTDASFKTYCTPLSLPFPVEVQQGTQIQQSVALTLKRAPERDVEYVSVQTEPVASIHVGANAAPLPKLGLGCSSSDESLDATVLSLLKGLNLSHLRLDLVLSDPTYRARLRRAVSKAITLEVPLEIALFLSPRAEAELTRLAYTLEQVPVNVVRWLVFHTAEKCTDPKWVRLAQKHLSRFSDGARFGGGTNAYFAELNRAQDSIRGLDMVNWSLNPQVHAFDNASLVETLEAQPATVSSARHFAPTQALCISPITLRPRFNPNATGTDLTPDDELPSQVDPRQMSLFAAGWTAISIKNLSQGGGVNSLTYYETTGWRGVMLTVSGSPLPQKFHANPNMVFPIYHVLAAIGEFAGGEVITTLSNQPLGFDGLALQMGARRRLLVVSFESHEQTVAIHGLSGAVQIICLDETNAADAMQEPILFRRIEGKSLATINGVLTVTLRPYAIVQIDWLADG